MWDQRLEVRLEGGVLDERGEYDNNAAPYTALRLEVWDRDFLSRDDFMGEATIHLCALMDSRTHTYTVDLEDPEGRCQADGGVSGSITVDAAFES